MFTLLGGSKYEVLSVLDLKDTFHSLRLTKSSKKYCGILPYFGSVLYLYQRMPMGLNISPMVWQLYINAILSCLSSRKYCEAIMDNLLLFTPNKQTHFEKLVDLLQALCKNGLKIFPKKCQLFKTELQYMENTIFIKEKRVCIKPLQSRLEAIQKLKPPTNQKGCCSFAGIVNFVSIFCPELQKLLKPIYKLMKKGRPFILGDEHQRAFDKIKNRLLNPPVLSMPDKRGRFLLYSDTSKHAMGSALYQVQNGNPKLIAYVSKGMPEAVRNYSVTELEMCSLAINIASFAHLLKRVDFNAVVDHLAITHIMKSKIELATNRIKRLLEILSSYSFNLYYIKGKDMILSDFLSRQIEDDSILHEIISILFNIQEILQEKYHHMITDTYNVQMRAQAKAQANAPTILDTQPVMQKVTPEVAKLPIETEEKKGTLGHCPAELPNNPQEALCCPQNFMLPPIAVSPNIRPPPMPPHIDETNTDLHQGPDPSMDIGRKFTSSRGNHNQNLCSPRSVLFRAATGTDQTGKHLKICTKASSATS